MVGIPLGAGLVLEMARRGRAGSVVALDPGGFWQGWEQTFFWTTITASIALVRALRPALPALTRNVTGRTGSMPQLSARPWVLDPGFVLNELQSFADTPTFDSLVKDLAPGQMQEGPATRSTRVVVGQVTRIACVCRSRPAARKLPTRKRQCTGSSAADTSLCGIDQIKRSASFSMPRIARTLDDAPVSWLVFEKAHSRARLRAHAIFLGRKRIFGPGSSIVEHRHSPDNLDFRPSVIASDAARCVKHATIEEAWHRHKHLQAMTNYWCHCRLRGQSIVMVLSVPFRQLDRWHQAKRKKRLGRSQPNGRLTSARLGTPGV